MLDFPDSLPASGGHGTGFGQWNVGRSPPSLLTTPPKRPWICLFSIKPLTKEDSVDWEEDGDFQDGWILAPCEGMQPSLNMPWTSGQTERNFCSVQPLRFWDGLMQKLACHDQYSHISRIISFPNVWYTWLCSLYVNPFIQKKHTLQSYQYELHLVPYLLKHVFFKCVKLDQCILALPKIHG